MNIAGLDRELKLFPVNENLQIAAFVILSDVEITQAAARELLAKAPEFDILMTAEAQKNTLTIEYQIRWTQLQRSTLRLCIWVRMKKI